MSHLTDGEKSLPGNRDRIPRPGQCPGAGRGPGISAEGPAPVVTSIGRGRAVSTRSLTRTPSAPACTSTRSTRASGAQQHQLRQVRAARQEPLRHHAVAVTQPHDRGAVDRERQLDRKAPAPRQREELARREDPQLLVLPPGGEGERVHVAVDGVARHDRVGHPGGIAGRRAGNDEAAVDQHPHRVLTEGDVDECVVVSGELDRNLSQVHPTAAHPQLGVPVRHRRVVRRAVRELLRPLCRRPRRRPCAEPGSLGGPVQPVDVHLSSWVAVHVAVVDGVRGDAVRPRRHAVVARTRDPRPGDEDGVVRRLHPGAARVVSGGETDPVAGVAVPAAGVHLHVAPTPAPRSTCAQWSPSGATSASPARVQSVRPVPVHTSIPEEPV